MIVFQICLSYVKSCTLNTATAQGIGRSRESSFGFVICARNMASYRVPRPIIPTDKRALNKRIVEVLAERLYLMELEHAPGFRLWEYREAAWAIEDVEQNIGLVYRTMGLRGIQRIENICEKMGVVVEHLIHELS